MTFKDWLPTLIVGIATIIGLIGVALITRKQTDRQIENQNKQIHRPYIHIELADYDAPNKKIMNGLKTIYVVCSRNFVTIKENMISDVELLKYDLNLIAKNTTENIALSIWIYDCYNKKKIYAGGVECSWQTEQKPIEKAYFSPIKILPLDVFENHIQVQYLKQVNEISNEQFDYAMLMIFYTDMHGNIYKTLIRIRFEVVEGQLYRPKYIEYFERSKAFRQALMDCNVDEKKIEEEYYKDVLDTKII